MTDEIEIFEKEDFRKWLSKNHSNQNKICLILHKKHTGKNSPSHRELIEEAICFGWIDTTIKRIDEDKYMRFFTRRNKNSRWSYNTLSYAKKLIKEKRMTSSGLKFYKEGLEKTPHDYGIEKNPKISGYLKKRLKENKKAGENFNKLAPSYQKAYLRWILRAKLPETREKRIDILIDRISKEKGFGILKNI